MFNSFATPWTVAHQAPLPMEFSRQEYWSGLLFPPWDLPNLGIDLASPMSSALACRFFTTSAIFVVTGQEDPLKKEMETHSSILFWKIT